MAEKNSKGKTYSWILDPLDGMLYFESDYSYQTLTGLWEVTELSTFHDAELAKATKEINAILKRAEESNKDPERKLSFIRFHNQHFLVWARYGAVGPSDEPETIIRKLKLKVK